WCSASRCAYARPCGNPNPSTRLAPLDPMTGIADTIRRAAEEVEEFRGDYEQLAAVMRDSWADGPGAPYLYTAALLADWLGGPGTPLAPAIYTHEGLVAFAAGLPPPVEIAGGTP